MAKSPSISYTLAGILFTGTTKAKDGSGKKPKRVCYTI